MYKYYNINPTRRKLPDCVCRAISLATRTSYGIIMDILEQNGLCNDCEETSINCYSNVIENLGYITKDANNKTVEMLCNDYPDNILLIRIDGHLTCCINGCCYDIWDCTNEKADIFWVIE